MSESEESYDDSDRGEESDTSSESDAEVKYLTFPNRGLRWAVGSPKPKNPVRGTSWNKSKGLRLPSKDQQDMASYVPGRMPKLIRKAEAHIAADYKEGGAGSIRADCQICKKKFSFSTDPEVESKELIEHVVKCWGPTEEPPFVLYDERSRTPTIMGNVAVEEDEDCLVFSVHSPGPFGGAYMMLLAFPLYMKPSLDMLDTTLRREWFHEKCSHLSMFIKRTTGSVEEERKMYNGFRENMTMTLSKKTANSKFLESVTRGYQPVGRLVWAREHKGVFWPAVVMEEEGTGNSARRDPDEDEEETWPRNYALQWHVVFLGREGKRMWARDSFDTFKMRFRGKEEIKNWFYRDVTHLEEGEEKTKWEKAVEMATKLSKLGSEEEVLKEVAKLGLTSCGKEIKDLSLMKMLVDVNGEEGTTKMVESWKNDPGQFKWSFYKSLYNRQLPHPLPVEKIPGFSYWPLMGVEKGSEEQREEWEKLYTPDRTDLSLKEIFTESGESAIYQYHLVDGFRNRCKVVFMGQKFLRLRGKCRRLPCGEQLVRDPEYERDLGRMRRTSPGGDQKPKPDALKMIYHSMPPINKPSILAQNEPPFIPCINCKEKTAEFCDQGKYIDLRSWENPDTKLKEYSGVFCSTPCARAWSEATKTELPVGNTLDLENSPRAGMCEFSKNIFTPLHLMPLHKLERELFGPHMPGYGLYAENGQYIEDEKAEGRHHPLWPKDRRRKYRDNKREWQDLILGRIEMFGLETPPVRDLSKDYYD